MKKVIKQWTNEILYLDKNIIGYTELCVYDDNGMVTTCKLLTSDEVYSKWLFKNHASLIGLSEENFFDKRRYEEFHNLCDKLLKA